MFGKKQDLEFQCLEKGKIQNSNVWKKAKFRIPMFGKRQNLEFQCLEKRKIQNSNDWKKAKFRIPML